MTVVMGLLVGRDIAASADDRTLDHQIGGTENADLAVSIVAAEAERWR
jgi:hypothetical protein